LFFTLMLESNTYSSDAKLGGHPHFAKRAGRVREPIVFQVPAGRAIE
jgi:hypothetical protein